MAAFAVFLVALATTESVEDSLQFIIRVPTASCGIVIWKSLVIILVDIIIYVHLFGWPRARTKFLVANLWRSAPERMN